MEFKIDTGADISVISEQTYKALNTKPDLMCVNAALDCPGGKLQPTSAKLTKNYLVVFF